MYLYIDESAKQGLGQGDLVSLDRYGGVTEHNSKTIELTIIQSQSNECISTKMFEIGALEREMYRVVKTR